LRARLADVGQQKHGPHEVLGGLAHVAGGLDGFQRFGQCWLVFQALEVLGIEVLVQQRQRLGQGPLVVAHQRREALRSEREPGDPRQQALTRGRGRGGRGVGCVRRAFVVGVVQLEDPGVEPAPASDGLGQHLVPPADERCEILPRCAVRGAEGLSGSRPGGRPEGPPIPLRHRLRLQQHAAKVTVERTDIQGRAGRGRCGQFVEQRLQVGDLGVGKITHECGVRAASCGRGVGLRGAGR